MASFTNAIELTSLAMDEATGLQKRVSSIGQNGLTALRLAVAAAEILSGCHGGGLC